MIFIGLTGSAGSGKSTVARILVEQHGFTEVCLADPLKRFLVEVFQFTDEQLWGPSEKRNEQDLRFPLPWCTCTNTRRMYGPGKDIKGYYPCHTCGKSVWVGYGVGSLCLSPRFALQTLGTEWGRALYEDVWIGHALDIIRKMGVSSGDPGEIFWYDRRCGLTIRYVRVGPNLEDLDMETRRPIHKAIVIPDVRFDNEAARIRAANGTVWKIVPRPDRSLPDVGAHASERGVNPGLVDRIVENPFEQVGLMDNVKAALEKENHDE